ncbi:MAG: beta-galactosidase [Armatimonadetes bacterium]|nr:beta-galactosidase [Candidatus Hippobium faecium]
MKTFIFLILFILLTIMSVCLCAENRLKPENGRFYRDGKPFFPFGYVFGRTDEDMKRLKKAKANSVHTEFSFFDLYPENENVSEQGIESVRDIFVNAQNNNLIYFPLLTGHYIPGWFSEKMKDHETPKDINGNPIGIWFVYSLHDRDFKNLLHDYWKVSAKEYASFDNVGAYVLWNEPGYGLDATSYSLADFRTYMKDKFITLGNLNSTCGTAFASFNDIYVPKTSQENRAYWYEWVYFNQKSFADFFKEEAKIIKENDPNAMVTLKNPIEVMSGDNKYMNNVSLMSEFQDFYGCDMYNGSPTKFRDAFEAVRSMSGKSPVITFEMHQQKGLTDKDPILSISQIVAQIIGGCRGIMYFHGGDEEGWGIWNDNTNPPEVREKIFELGEKINRYPEVFSSVRNKADIALLYSNHSLIQYGTDPSPVGRYKYGNLIEEIYSAVRNRHYALDLISDSQLKTGLKDYKLLIIPSYSILSKEETETVAEFHRKGGKIIAFSHSLEKTPYFEDSPIPSFFGLKSRSVAPWNADHIVLVDTIEELRPYMKGEMIVQEPELADGLPMEQNIPGYIVKTENTQTALVASQDVFPSVIQSNDGQVIYCAFLSTNSEGMGSLIDGLIEKRLNIRKEISVTDKKGNEATEIMTALCKDGDKNVIMILNPTKLEGTFTFSLRDIEKGEFLNIANGKKIKTADGKFTLKLKGGEYAFLTE